MFRHIIMLLLTVAIKMKFHLCTISIAFPLKSGVYCNRISDFATWESERQANTGGSLETRDLVLPTAKKLAEHQEEGKDISGRLCWFPQTYFDYLLEGFFWQSVDGFFFFFFGGSVFLLTILSWKRLWPSGCGFYFCEKELLCPWHATSKNKCSMKRTWIKMLYISRSN